MASDTGTRDSAMPQRFSAYGWAALACAAVTALAYPVANRLDHANIVMVYLLAVALIAMQLGRNPAIATAIGSVLLFDFFFVDPRFSFAVADAQYLITFGVMLAVALIVGALTARLRLEADAANARETRTSALYGLARDLSGALTVEAAAAHVIGFVRGHLAANAVLLLPDRAGTLVRVEAAEAHLVDPAVPSKAFEQGESLPFVDRHNGNPALAVPLVVAGRARGVLVATAPDRDYVVSRSQRPLLDAVATLAAIVVERLHFVDVARDATIEAESERLRNSLLSAVSHDLRTPLTVLVGHADALAAARPRLPPAQAETAAVMRDEALRMSRMVSDLLEMARLQAGRFVLRKEWQPLEDVVQTSVRTVESGTAGRSVEIALPDDLPLVEFDSVLIERVLTNLLDNAAKHGRRAIGVKARVQGDEIEIDVTDEGAGIAPGDGHVIFRMFEQGAEGGRCGGAGMGLAICKAIVEAHGGRIAARNRPEGGACFSFTLPLGHPPRVDVGGDEPVADR